METTRRGGVGWWGAAVGVVGLLAGCAGGPQVDEAKARWEIEQAHFYLAQGLNDSALAAFGLALEEDFRLTEAHLGMGDIYRERGDHELAARAYERAVRTDPTSFEANYYLGLMRQVLGQVQESVRAYLQALAIRPNDYRANQALASAYLQLNRPADAVAYAQKATELHSSDQGAWANLGAAQALLGKYPEALEAYKQAGMAGGMSNMPEPVKFGMADAHIHLGQYAEASALLKEMAAGKPSVSVWERLGYCQFKQQQFGEALASYRAAVRLDGNDTAALNGLGVALMARYIEEGGTDGTLKDQAIEAWRKSLRLRPDQPRIVDLLVRYQRM